jgi:membrane protein DedA with SNARE-associated domain
MYAFLLLITKYSYVGIFIALGLGIVGLPIPDESLIAFTGFLSSQGKLNFALLLLVIIAGTSLGITASYLLGKFARRYVSDKYNKISVNAAHLQNIKEFYGKYGGFALLIGYFIPGVRHLTAIFAGMNYMTYRRFALFAYTGASLWTTTFLTLGYWLGYEWHLVSHFSNRILIPAIFLVTLVLFLLLYLRNRNIKDM